MNQNNEKGDIFIIIGGGLVIIFEKRVDPRIIEFSKDRDINVGFSERGIFAMKALGLEEFVFKNGVPFDKRIVHAPNGKKIIIEMGNKNQCIYAMNRFSVHNVLLTEIEKYSNICIHFNHKLISYDIKNDQMIFQLQDNNKKLINTSDYIVIGCDGVFSKIRSEINKISLINYHLQISDLRYIRLNITEPIDCKKSLEPNIYHIWPRGNMILNGIPNKDKRFGFYFSLDMPLEQFDAIKDNRDLNQLFEERFPDLIDIYGRNCIKNLPASIKPSTFVTVKCSSYNYLDKVLIMGDAAHAMMPFLGQGMNCGFEDCVILDQIISQTINNIKIRDILPSFSQKRVDNCNTMVDLSMDKYNYVSNDSKRSWLFISRYQFDIYLNLLLADIWIPIERMVIFTRIDYIKCLEYRIWQDRVIYYVINAIILLFIVAIFCNILLYIQI